MALLRKSSCEVPKANRYFIPKRRNDDMKKMGILLIVALILNNCASINIKGTGYEKRAIELQNLITEIQSALAVVNSEVEKKTNLELNNAFLIVNTEIGKSKEGGADLWVVSSKASKENKSSDKVSIKLVPLKQEKYMTKSSEKTLSERLAMSIVSAVEGVSNAGTGKYPMSVNQLVIEMEITTKTVGTAGATLEFEVLPISVSGKGTYSESDVNLLKIEFTQRK
jgi:hypothetical protein